MNPDEINVKTFLEDHGFKVNRISETTSKTCDFQFSDGHDKYSLEVKARESDRAFETEIKTKDIVSRSRPHGPTNRISRILKDAVKQLDSLVSDSKTYELIWFVIREPWHPELVFKQIRSTLYGIQDIVCDHNDIENAVVECYYFRHSAFHRFRQLDAVVIEKESGIVVCVNDCAQRYSEFIKSSFYSMFKRGGGLVEPKEREQNGQCFIADCSTDRSEEEAIEKYVKEKYRLQHAITVTFEKHHTVARVDDK